MRVLTVKVFVTRNMLSLNFLPGIKPLCLLRGIATDIMSLFCTVSVAGL